MSARTAGRRMGRSGAATPAISATEGAQAPRDAASAPGTATTRLLTAAELAERWQVRPKQVYALVNRGDVPCIFIGRYRRFRLEAIEAWERAQEGRSNEG
ncbi:MAG TPA: helix-turn-helix domain-containing protein [Conexibacter sp.]|nr:helix-turn-helix domain-containing protein [Conexibacter sp.]